jgi:hypothetical protein
MTELKRINGAGAQEESNGISGGDHGKEKWGIGWFMAEALRYGKKLVRHVGYPSPVAVGW